MVGYTRSDRLVTALLKFRSILATAAETFHMVKTQIEMRTSQGILHEEKTDYSGIAKITFSTQPHPNLGNMRLFGISPNYRKINVFLRVVGTIAQDKLKVDGQCRMRFYMRLSLTSSWRGRVRELRSLGQARASLAAHLDQPAERGGIKSSNWIFYFFNESSSINLINVNRVVKNPEIGLQQAYFCARESESDFPSCKSVDEGANASVV